MIRLYGENDTINYLYEYSLIKGVEDKWLLRPIINYRVIDDANCLTKLYDIFLTSDFIDGNNAKRDEMLSPFKSLIDKIINEIFEILNEMIIKKGIIWLPNIYMVKYIHKMLIMKNIENIKTYYSTATYNEYDNEFRDSNGNCLMLACDKFKTGFDGVNMEFGINLQLNDSGHVLIQKLGRFTRPKEKQQYAYLYQFCENRDVNATNIVNSLVNACNGFGISLEEISNKITVTNEHKAYNRNVSTNNIITFELSYDKLNIDEIKTKMFLELNGGLTEKNIKSLIQKHNTNIINNSELKLYDLVNDKYIIYTKKQVLKYLNSNKIGIHVISEVTNYVDFCIPPKLLTEIRELFCKMNDLQRICIKLEITNIRNYKNKYRKCKKLPPLYLITSGFYSVEHEIFNIYQFFDSISVDTTF